MSKCRHAREKEPQATQISSARGQGRWLLRPPLLLLSPHTALHGPWGSPVVSAHTPIPGPAITTFPLGGGGCRAFGRLALLLSL